MDKVIEDKVSKQHVKKKHGENSMAPADSHSSSKSAIKLKCLWYLLELPGNCNEMELPKEQTCTISFPNSWSIKHLHFLHTSFCKFIYFNIIDSDTLSAFSSDTLQAISASPISKCIPEKINQVIPNHVYNQTEFREEKFPKLIHCITDINTDVTLPLLIVATTSAWSST